MKTISNKALLTLLFFSKATVGHTEQNKRLRGSALQQRQSSRIVQQQEIYIPDRFSEPNMDIINAYLGLTEEEEFYLNDDDVAFYANASNL